MTQSTLRARSRARCESDMLLPMRSRSLLRWRTDRMAQLDQIANAHASVEGSGPGRRYATQQVNHAYAMLLASQFQGFCRDLHSEAADVMGRSVRPNALRPLFVQRLTADRQLDRGNAQPGSIGADFGRFFASKFWDEVDHVDQAERVAQRHRAPGLRPGRKSGAAAGASPAVAHDLRRPGDHIRHGAGEAAASAGRCSTLVIQWSCELQRFQDTISQTG